VSELVADSRALGETLLAKRLADSELAMLYQRRKLYAQEGLTKLAQDLQVDRKRLIEEAKASWPENIKSQKIGGSFEAETSLRCLLVG